MASTLHSKVRAWIDKDPDHQLPRLPEATAARPTDRGPTPLPPTPPGPRRRVIVLTRPHRTRRSPKPSQTRRSPPGPRPEGLPSVREGGVEPPRPFGHWNLNPARLPIPPPAHWVCPRALPPGGWRLPTCRRLARCTGWIHIPFPWAGPPVPASGTLRARPPSGVTGSHPTRPLAPVTPSDLPLRTPPTPRHVSTHVSTWTGSRINLVPVTAISPGGGQGPQSGAGHLSAAPSTILGRSSAQAVVQKEFDGPTRGNQPIYRRVDTISKQYQGSQHDNHHYRHRDRHHGSRHGGRYDSQCGDDGGGAPWES